MEVNVDIPTLTVVFSFGIFFIGFLALLLTSFNALLTAKIEPLKENQARIEGRMDKLEGRMDKLEGRMDKLEGRMDKLEGRMDRLESKIDLLLAQNGKSAGQRS